MNSNRELTPEEVAEQELANQFPPARRRESFNMGLGEFEPVETDYRCSTILYRCKAINTEEEAHAKARAFLGERYAAVKAFRTARYWVFYLES
jgi:hypothetical protein